MKEELWAQYGLLGIVLFGLGALAFWALRHVAQPVAAKHIEVMGEVIKTLQEMRIGLAMIAETAAELKTFRRESFDEDMPYSAVKGERGIAILGEMLVTMAPPDRRDQMERLQNKLDDALKRS